MTTLREAAQQALEALELPCSRWNGTQSKIVNDAITALRAALAEPVQDGKCKHCVDGCPACDARKLPVQEPVAWRYKISPPFWTYSEKYPNKEFAGDAWDKWQVTPLYTAPPQRKED